MSTPTIFLDKKFVYFNELQLHRYLENFILNRTSQKRKTSQVCMYLSTPDVFFTFRNFLWNDEDGTLKTFDIIFQRYDQMYDQMMEYRENDILFTKRGVYFFPATPDNDAIRCVASRYGELVRTFYVERDVTIEDFLNSEQFLMYFRKFHMRLDYEEISRGLELLKTPISAVDMGVSFYLRRAAAARRASSKACLASFSRITASRCFSRFSRKRISASAISRIRRIESRSVMS